jgi:UDP-N-acetylmuramyl pentapeptide phosphotransferase/UDP-N-acetylglucosamine-1-phosphate transferase
MKFIHAFLFMLMLAASSVLPLSAAAQTSDARLADIEERLSHVEHRGVQTDQGAGGVAIFLCGAFCALWAQQTRRSAWLWFFLGVIGSVITLIVLLVKNAGDRHDHDAQ